MSLDAFEKAAKEADEGLAAALGAIQQLHDAGRLRHWVIAYDFTDEMPDPDSDSDGASHCQYSDAIAGLGLAEFIKHNIFGGYEATD